MGTSSTRNMSQHVTKGWPNACNMLHPAVLGYVTFKCCDRLAGSCKCWANNVGICCLEISLSFDRDLRKYNLYECHLQVVYYFIDFQVADYQFPSVVRLERD